MNKEEIIEKLEELTGADLYFGDKSPASEYADDIDELLEWASMFEETEFVDFDFSDHDIDDCYAEWYSGQTEDRDYSAFIIYCDNSIISYGYASD